MFTKYNLSLPKTSLVLCMLSIVYKLSMEYTSVMVRRVDKSNVYTIAKGTKLRVYVLFYHKVNFSNAFQYKYFITIIR